MAVTWASILVRIRHRLVEEGSGDFWTDARLKEWFDEGLKLQHWRVFENAEKTGRIGELEHPYLRLFLKNVTFNIAVATQDYAYIGGGAIAADVWRPAGVRIMDQVATRVPFSRDRMVRRYPQFGPTPTQPLWTITPDEKIRIYVGPNSDGSTAPVQALPNGGTLDYYADITATGTDSPVEEPFNVGPIEYVCGMAMARERTNPNEFWFPKAQMEADKILAPPPQVVQR